jgi:peptide/nickel transport system substrate-binding protein
MTASSRAARVLVAATLVLGLAACSSSSDSGDTGDQVLRYAPQLFPVSLDVQQYPAEEPVQTTVQQALETLTVIDNGQPAPKLATKWDTPDPKTWVFHLREGVNFSDGTPFTDDKTVTIRTSAPLGTLPSSLSLIFIGQGAKVGDDAYWQKPIGTGPFTIDSFSPDDKVVLTRNEGYWGDKAKVARLEILDMPEVAARVTALSNNEVDVLASIPPDQVTEVSDVDGVKYGTGDSYNYYFAWFNQNRKPFNDIRVRQALLHALDLQGTISGLFGDLGTVGRSPVTQAVFGATQLEPPTHDTELAKQLLAQAGYPNGIDISMQWPLEGGPNIKAMAQAFISDWAKAGIRVKPLEKERATWLKDFAALDWDINLQTNTTGTGDADFTLNRLYTCAAKRLGYCNKDLDAILAQARASLDPNERKTLYAQADKMLWDDAVAAFPVDLKTNYAVRDNVQGFEMPVNGRPDFAKVSIG